MKIILSHPTGNQNVRAVVTSLFESNLLAEFCTTFAVDPTAIWLKFLTKGIREECLRRSFPIPLEKIWTNSAFELLRMVFKKIGFQKFIKHEQGFTSIDAVYKNFDNAVARHLSALPNRNNFTAIYAYEDGALSTFTHAKKAGLKCIYDLPIAYWKTGRELMFDEKERLPAWASTLGGGIQDSQNKLDRKIQELELADIIVSPSKFVMDSIPESARMSKRIIMAPFGSPKPKAFNKKPENRKTSVHLPLRVLFAGSLSQRKGLGDLFAAVKLINRRDLELVVMGSLQAPLDFYLKEFSGFRYEQGRPHDQVLSLMESCEVFCLPSIVEGRALVMQEAMSQGLPIIITPNTGGEDLVIEGKTGFLVPIRSPEAIANKITWFLDNRTEISEMGQLAKAHAAKYTWENYGKQLIKELNCFLM